MLRREFLLGALAAPILARPAWASEAIEVFKSPTCGCCSAWIAHMEAAGFRTLARDIDQDRLTEIKARAGIPPALTSCHTAHVGDWVIEGHVPAGDVARLLAERPDAIGLTVPGMPIGSPGMEMGDRREPYDTLLILRDGSTRVFASHR